MKQLLTLMAMMCALVATAAHGDSGLVTELDVDHVDISANFAGEHVMIFGAVSRPGDVIIKVVSPPETIDLAHKAKFGPFWLTAGKARVEKTPGLLYVLSNKPVDQLLDKNERDRYGLDLADSLTDAKVTGKVDAADGWQDAFMHLKQQNGYYIQDGAAVKLVSNQLFSATMKLPAKLPLGTYRLEIYRVRAGQVRGHQEQTFDVREVKLERWVSDAAYTHPITFGVLFTLLALTIGLVLGIALRKGDR